MKKTGMLILWLAALSLTGYSISPGSKTEKHIPKVEVVFVLDCTGSMGGLIQTAKEKIWSIATNLTQAETAPEISIGLVGYRDRGDDFITKTSQLSDDLDKVYSELMSFSATGGGDGPESVNQALYDAVSKIEWNEDKNTYKTIFLVGDYPPHMDYKNDVKYHESCKLAGNKGIIINTIQMGTYAPTTPIWQEIAQLTDGEFFKVDQSSAGGLMVSTPYDEMIGTKSKELDKTRLWYGTSEEKSEAIEAVEVEEEIYGGASKESIARRAVFNVSASGKKNFAGTNELIQAIENKDITLDKIEKTHLPDEMQKMTKEEQEVFVDQKIKERKKIESEIKELEEKRQAYIRDELEKREDKGKNSFSEKVYDVVKTQAKDKKINYTGSVKH